MFDKLVLQYSLFPFDRVIQNSTVVIYGAGDAVKDFADQAKSINYCKVLYIIDKNIIKHSISDRMSADNDNQKIQSRLRVKFLGTEQDYDQIVVAADDADTAKTLEAELIEIGVKECKIVLPVAVLSKSPKLIRLEGFSWDEYYSKAEAFAKEQFYTYINPFIKQETILLNDVLDFGCGHGRMSEILAGVSKHLVCCDISTEAVAYCRKRFTTHISGCRIEFIQNTQTEIKAGNIPLADASIDFLLTWDTMVHMDYKWIDRYFKEFYRVLRDGGYGLIHHSNIGALTELCASDIWFLNQNGRSNISAADIEFITEKHGFSVIRQRQIHGALKEMDYITLIRKTKIS